MVDVTCFAFVAVNSAKHFTLVGHFSVSLLSHFTNLSLSVVKGKGKAHPMTGHEDPEGEQTYISTFPSTSAPDGGGWSTPRRDRFTPGKDPVPIV